MYDQLTDEGAVQGSLSDDGAAANRGGKMEAVMTVAQRSIDNHAADARAPGKKTTPLISFEEFLLDILKRPERPGKSSTPRKRKRKKKLTE